MVTEPVPFDNFSESLEPMLYEWNSRNMEFFKNPFYRLSFLMYKKSTFYFIQSHLEPSVKQSKKKIQHLLESGKVPKEERIVPSYYYDQPFEIKVFEGKKGLKILVRTFNGVIKYLKDIKTTQWSSYYLYKLKPNITFKYFMFELESVNLCPRCLSQGALDLRVGHCFDCDYIIE